MRAFIIAASLVATVPVGAAADAKPPRHGYHGQRHQVCRVVLRHGHRVRVCR